MNEDNPELNIIPLKSEKDKGTSQKHGKKGDKEEASEKISDIKEKTEKKKEEASEKVEDVKEDLSEKKEDLKGKIVDAKEEIEKKKENLKKESKKEGVTPAEKVVTDIFSKLKQGAGQINETIADYTQEGEGKKELKKPLIDVLETNEKIIVIADLSDVKKEDIDIGLSKNCLELLATFKEDVDIEGARFIQKERNYGKVYRRIPLSSEIKVKEAMAKYKDCSLIITLPKKQKDVTKVKID